MFDHEVVRPVEGHSVHFPDPRGLADQERRSHGYRLLAHELAMDDRAARVGGLPPDEEVVRAIEGDEGGIAGARHQDRAEQSARGTDELGADAAPLNAHQEVGAVKGDREGGLADGGIGDRESSIPVACSNLRSRSHAKGCPP